MRSVIKGTEQPLLVGTSAGGAISNFDGHDFLPKDLQELDSALGNEEEELLPEHGFEDLCDKWGAVSSTIRK